MTAAERAILEAREAGLETELARIRDALGTRGKPRRARRHRQPLAPTADELDGVTSLDEQRIARSKGMVSR